MNMATVQADAEAKIERELAELSNLTSDELNALMDGMIAQARKDERKNHYVPSAAEIVWAIDGYGYSDEWC